jgi:hypothetical protein
MRPIVAVGAHRTRGTRLRSARVLLRILRSQRNRHRARLTTPVQHLPPDAIAQGIGAGPTAPPYDRFNVRGVHGRNTGIYTDFSGNICRFSARFHGKDNDLAGVNSVGISDLVLVRFVDDCVPHARAVGDTADAPEAVATGYDRGRDLGHDHAGW